MDYNMFLQFMKGGSEDGLGDSSDGAPKKSNMMLIVGAVVVLIICCCCISIGYMFMSKKKTDSASATKPVATKPVATTPAATTPAATTPAATTPAATTPAANTTSTGSDNTASTNVYNTASTTAYNASIPSDTLKPNEMLSSNGKNKLLSNNKIFTFIMQEDGHLCLYKNENGKDIYRWGSGTNGKGVGPYTLVNQGDGNLVIYDSNKNPLWANNTFNNTHNIIMQDDGNLVSYNQQGQPVWATNTYS